MNAPVGKRIGELLLYGVFIIVDAEGVYSQSHELALVLFIVGTVGLALYDGGFSRRVVIIVGIATTMLSALIYVIFPYAGPAPHSGWLQPANDPTPDNGCGKSVEQRFGIGAVAVIVGDNGFVVTPFRAMQAVVLGECDSVTMNVGPNGLSIGAQLFDTQGLPIGVINDNRYEITGDSRAEVETDLNTLVVHDRAGNELLYVRYLNPSAIRVKGIFSCPKPRLISITVTNSFIATPGHNTFGHNCVANTSEGLVIR